MGQPAKVKRPAEERDLTQIHHAAEHYVNAAKGYRDAANLHRGF
jgi:carbonic anhydrase/acetyltransferase-like protein (isoleucine patch superfamily)